MSKEKKTTETETHSLIMTGVTFTMGRSTKTLIKLLITINKKFTNHLFTNHLK